MTRPARTRDEVESSRQSILRAAVGVFAERGYEAATMKEIAGAAGYSAPSLYGYFRSKQAIAEALVQEAFEDLAAMHDVELPSALPLEQRVQSLLAHQGAWLLQHRDLLYFASRHRGPLLELKSPNPSNAEIQSRFVDQLTAWLRAHARPEELHGRDPALLGLMLSGVLTSAFRKWVREGATGTLEDDLGAMVEIVFHGVKGRTG